MSGYPQKVKQLSLSHHSRFLATGGGEQICIWDFSGKGPAGTKPTISNGHVDVVADVAFQPRGELLASLGRDGALLWWNTRRGAKPLALGIQESGGCKVAWSPTGTVVAALHESGVVASWRTPALLKD
jgi:WD40 repeat protein